MSLKSADHPKKVLYTVSKSMTSNYSLCAEIFLSLQGYKNSYLTDKGHYYARDYAMERGLTGT
jgi:hypothetical protein